MSSRKDLEQRWQSLLAPLTSTQRLLQFYPGDEFLVGRQAKILEEIRLIQERRGEFLSHSKAARCIALGDRMNASFFATHRERPPGMTLWDVLDERGCLQMDPDTVMRVATS
ncbi:hypothetical protein GOP47_0004350 [Adiantum capillus-veneris]|uniref:Uncharacterized protein n=1 Tax=Adiantum capillus-veneris TaxID=13818 RepID=A0A9D4V7Y5_ADICA|nr:hypothetical protein GOP47_0004350 [Adiantum capillus-veneris]